MRERIIYTRPEDYGVNIISPSDRCYSVLTGSGAYEVEPWRGSRVWMERQVKHFGQSVPPVAEPIARRWVMAMAFGGLSRDEFFTLLIDKDVPEESRRMAEIVAVDDLPKDRWFRNAWTRSPNGGPITVDLERARSVQASYIINTLEEVRRQRRGLPPAGLVLLGLSHLPDPVRVNLTPIFDAISTARDEDDLRAVWPEELKYAHPDV